MKSSEKPKQAETPGKTNKARQMLLVAREGVSDERLIAEAALHPTIGNASTAVDFSKGLFPDLCLQDCIAVIEADIKQVNGGDLNKLEGMLTAQATALNSMFNSLAKLSCHADYLPKMEAYMRLALKAQSQCRTTVEAIAEIKFPKSATFIRQANVSHGPQQVNNGQGFETNTRAHAEESQPEQSKLLEDGTNGGTYLDTGAATKASRSNSALETMGAVHRAEKRGR